METSEMPSFANKQFSISSGWIFSPPRMIKSLIRPVIVMYPSGEIEASSPV